MIKNFAAIAAAASLGAGGTALVMQPKPPLAVTYNVHAMDLRKNDKQITAVVYGTSSTKLPDGKIRKVDIGRFPCSLSQQDEASARALMVSAESCINPSQKE